MPCRWLSEGLAGAACVEAEDLYGSGLAGLERQWEDYASYCKAGSCEQLKPLNSARAVCLSGDGGGVRLGQNFTQGLDTSAIFRSCRAGHLGAWAAAVLCPLLVGTFRRPSSCCRAWPLPVPRHVFNWLVVTAWRVRET